MRKRFPSKISLKNYDQTYRQSFILCAKVLSFEEGFPFNFILSKFQCINYNNRSFYNVYIFNEHGKIFYLYIVKIS